MWMGAATSIASTPIVARLDGAADVAASLVVATSGWALRDGIVQSARK
jgi:hypothetical protein